MFVYLRVCVCVCVMAAASLTNQLHSFGCCRKMWIWLQTGAVARGRLDDGGLTGVRSEPS